MCNKLFFEKCLSFYSYLLRFSYSCIPVTKNDFRTNLIKNIIHLVRDKVITSEKEPNEHENQAKRLCNSHLGGYKILEMGGGGCSG